MTLRMVVLVCVVLLPVACVGPARTPGQFESKAGQAARDATSQVRTAVITARGDLDGRLAGPYVDTVLSRSEDAMSSVRRSFGSIQPPADDQADRLRATLEPLLGQGVDGLAQLRILARRGDRAGLAAEVAALEPLADQLDRFAEEHSG